MIALQVVVSGLHDSGHVVVIWVDGRAVMRMSERLTGDPTATTPNPLPGAGALLSKNENDWMV